MTVSQTCQICLLEKLSRKKPCVIGKPNVPYIEFASVQLLQHSVGECLFNGSRNKLLAGLNFVWKQVEAGMHYMLRWLYSSLSCNKGNGKPWMLLYQLLKGFNIGICNCCTRAPDISYTIIINIPSLLYFSKSLSFSVLFRN